MKEISPIEWKNYTLNVLDQTLLPGTKKYIVCKNYREVEKAIKEMKLRGAPLIGIVAALAIAMEVKRSNAGNYNKLIKQTTDISNILLKTRPTAINLKWALDRMIRVAEHNKDRRIGSVKELVI